MLQWAQMIESGCSDRVRPARRLGSTGLRLLELADDGETDRKAASGKCRGQNGEAVKVVRRLAVEHGQNPFERFDGRTEFAAGLSGARYVHPRRELQPLVAAGQAQGPLARRQRFCVASLQDKTIGGKGMNPSEPGAVLELCGNLFGRVEAIKRFLDAALTVSRHAASRCANRSPAWPARRAANARRQ